jgi:hypothetical protein
MPRLRRFVSQFRTHLVSARHVPLRMLRTLAILALISIAAALAAGAQEVTGSIIGTVSDPQGAVLRGAQVTARNVDRGTVATTQTNDSGDFTLTRLPIGNYEVSVTMAGFEKHVHPVFALVLNQTAKVDFQLKIGSPTETVEVGAEAPLLGTDTTDVSTHIDSVVTENVPLITRNYGQLTLLAPGSLSLNPGAFVTGQSTFQIGRPYINGQREQVNNYILDGMDNNQSDNNEVAYAPNVDAIQEFNLITQNPSAEFGNFLGGVVNVSIKSGTNQFHGEGFEFLRNYALNANNWFNNAFGRNALGDEIKARPRLHYNQFGGTFGGPIVKDKLFFFVDYQGQLSSTPSTQSAGVLDAAERTGNLGELCSHAGGVFNASGQCSVVSGQLFAPSSGVSQANRPFIPFNNLTAAGLTLSPAATALFGSALYPLPNAGGNVLNYQQVVKNNLNQGDAKIDWNPDQKDQFFIRYSQQAVSNPTTATFVLNQNGITNFYYPLQNGVADWTRTISASMLNDARFGVSYFPVNQNFSNPTGQNLPQLFGIPGTTSTFLPSLTGASGGPGFGNIAPIANNLGQQNQFHDTVIQFTDVLSKAWRAHQFRTGFQFDRYRDNFLFPGIEGLAGTIGFSGQYTSTLAPDPANPGKFLQVGGSGVADLLLGLPSQVQLGSGAGNRYLNNSLFGAFFQDTWRVRRDLTLDLGLRWDLNTARVAQGGAAANYTIFGGQFQTPTINNNGLGAALYHTYNGIANFEPRIGLAWQPKFLPHTVIHAAYGISNFVESNGVNNLLTANPPFEIAHSVTFSPTSNFPGSTLSQGFNGFPASGCTLAAAAAESPACFMGTTIHIFDPNLRPEVHYQWNFSIEHQIGNSTTVTVGYVGSADQHLSNILNLEQRRLNANGTVSPTPFLNPTLVGFGGQDRLTVDNGLSNYNALQTSVVHRFSHGLQAQVNYTFSKCLSDTPGFFGQFGDNAGTEALTVSAWAFPQNIYNQRADYGRCPQDVASLFNGYVVYELPFGHGKYFGGQLNPALNAIVGGWNISSNFTLHTGFAQTVFGSDQSGTGSLNALANCVPGVPQEVPQNVTNVGGTPLVSFLNPAAVAPNVKGTFGNCGIGSFRGPSYKTVDASLAKNIRITERQSLELRMDAINLTNTPIFAFGSEFGGQHTQGSPVFGFIDASQGERQVQLGAKYRF